MKTFITKQDYQNVWLASWIMDPILFWDLSLLYSLESLIVESIKGMSRMNDRVWFKCFILNIFQGWFHLHFLNGNKLPGIHPNSSHLQWTKVQCCKMVVPLWSHVLCNICMQVRLFPVMGLSLLWVTTFFRAFTLAVFLKETLHNEKTDAPWAFFILLIMLSFNIGLFR